MRPSLVVIALGFWPIAAFAQPPSQQPAAPEAVELARINTSLREILSFLRKHSEVQATELLLKRVELAEARLGESNDRLRTVTAERRGLEAAKSSLDGRIEILAARMAQAPTETSPEIEAASHQVIVEKQRIQQRLAALGEETAKLENEISLQSADLLAWQDTLDRQLARH
jgi:predicted nuclease with TOPRIM domain